MKRLLFIGSRRFEIDTTGERLGAPSAVRLLDRAAAIDLVRRIAAVAENRMTLRRLLGETALGVGLDRLSDESLAEQVATLLLSGRAVLAEGPTAPYLAAHDGEAIEAPPAPTSAREAKVALTWIEIQLIGEDGQPIPGEKYRIDLPDGSVREGSLDSKGQARVDGIDPGNCVVTFPALDEEAWVRA